MSDRWIEYISIDDVIPADRNPKRHASEVIDQSMDRFEFTEPVLLDERTGKLIAGHGRLDTLKSKRDASQDPPPGVKVDGEVWSLPVVRGWSSKNDSEAEAYLVASNRLTELGGWEDKELFELLDSLDDLEGVGYTLDDLQAMSNAILELPPTGGSGDPDSVPEAPTEPRSRLGDVWICGAHRVICGDSTDVEVLKRLLGDDVPDMLWTDPPYGVSYVGKTKDALTIENDQQSPDELRDFLRAVFVGAATFTAPGGAW